MTYKIISTRQISETLFTTVEYNFDGNKVIVEVAHFMASSTEQIVANIANRAQSELAKLEAEALIASLLPNIAINEEKNL